MISGRYIFLLFITISSFSWGQEITVEDIWQKYTFFEKSVDGFRSMKDGNYFSKISEAGVTKHAFTDAEGRGEVLIPSNILSRIDRDDYTFNSDETKALLTTSTESIYRRSFTAVYYLYDLQTKEMQPLDNARSPQTLAEYSPDGTKVSYIFENNLYVKDIASGKVKQLTKDGKRNEIINGTTDWVYEEEFALIKGYGWSPDSKYIAFLKFDESNVREFTMTYFNHLYPDLYTFKYPKAGEDNSCVQAYMIAAKGGKAKHIDLGSYEYIPRLKWSGTSNQLVIQTMNRHQSSLKYHLVDMTSKKMSVNTFFEEKSKTYVEVDDNLLILKDGKSILRTSEANGYNHIYWLGFDGKTHQITTGNWDVIEFLGIDEDTDMVYYTSAEKGAIHKGIYKIGLDGANKSSLSLEEGHNDAEFSNGMKYFIKTYSNANTPPVFSLCDNTGKEISVLENNFQLNETLKAFTLSKKEFVTFKGHSEELNGWIIKPADFDPSKKYPVYVNIYCGPGHNTVVDSWGGTGYAYHQLLAQKGYIVVSVDPRGTMYRGAEFKKSTYRELGKLETQDLIAVAKELQTYDYVAADRIGIMGWSYGGFMTSLAMTAQITSKWELLLLQLRIGGITTIFIQSDSCKHLPKMRMDTTKILRLTSFINWKESIY